MWLEPTIPIHHIRSLEDETHELPDYRPSMETIVPKFDSQLSSDQQRELLDILNEFKSITNSLIRPTSLAVHNIDTE